MTLKILAFAGSTRTDSLNKKLIKTAAGMARDAGADVTLIDLRDFEMPLYDGDLEAEKGLPEKAKAFKKLLSSHDAILISSPEYNAGYSGVLKNAIDWASRTESKDEKPFGVFAGKPIGLMAASPGGLAGLRGLYALRDLFMNMGVPVIPQMQAVPAAHIGDDGALTDARSKGGVEAVVKAVITTAGAADKRAAA